MFGAAMLDEANCRGLLERVLEFPIGKIEVDKEKSIVYRPEFKSMFYEQLPDTYVIFICDYDPFFAGRYRYVFRNLCMEDGTIHLQDGNWTIFLNTKGTNADEISDDLLNLLKFIGAGLEDSQKDYKDPYIKQLQRTIDSIKHDREMGKRYMLLEELLMRERQESMELGIAKGIEKGMAKGKAESILYFLAQKYTVSEELSNHIMNETDSFTLDHWFKLAISADSIEQFMKNIHFTI